jgi:succinoglycan biosynthesis protein ExoV
MAILCYRAESGNFGDDLNFWLWPRLIPAALHSGTAVQFVGIGSILDKRMPSNVPILVFGAGVRCPDTIPTDRSNWDIRFVRGPLSASALGLGSDAYITDAAAALRLTDLALPDQKIHRFAFMPHFRSLPRADWKAICAAAEVRLIDPTSRPEVVLQEIASTHLLISEAMHGAIVADLLRVPWLRARCAAHRAEGVTVARFKWNDWAQSMGVDPTAEILPYMPSKGGSSVKKFAKRIWTEALSNHLARRLSYIANNGAFQLSNENILFNVIERMEGQITRLRHDFG